LAHLTHIASLISRSRIFSALLAPALVKKRFDAVQTGHCYLFCEFMNNPTILELLYGFRKLKMKGVSLMDSWFFLLFEV